MKLLLVGLRAIGVILILIYLQIIHSIQFVTVNVFKRCCPTFNLFTY